MKNAATIEAIDQKIAKFRVSKLIFIFHQFHGHLGLGNLTTLMTKISDGLEGSNRIVLSMAMVSIESMAPRRSAQSSGWNRRETVSIDRFYINDMDISPFLSLREREWLFCDLGFHRPTFYKLGLIGLLLWA